MMLGFIFGLDASSPHCGKSRVNPSHSKRRKSPLGSIARARRLFPSVYSAERRRQIAKVISDGATSSHGWLTQGQYNAYKAITSPDGKKIKQLRALV
jgi:hypothetical protein